MLGLDEEQTLAYFQKASGSELTPALADTLLQNAAPAAVRHGSSIATASDTRNSKQEVNLDHVEAAAHPLDNQLPWGIFAALLLLVALTLSLWSRFERTHAREAALIPASNPTASLPSAPATSGTAEPSPVMTHTPSPTSAAFTGSSTPSIAPASSPSEFSLVIQARKESWITITADGKPIASELMTSGTERTVRGSKQVVVKAGNAGAIEFQFNGQKFPAAGAYGEVKTVTFGPNGII